MKARKNETGRTRYLILNRVFVAILLLVILYSILYSPEKQRYPIPSGTQLFFGKSSPSTGLSRSFSAVVRFEFRLAKEYNPYGLRIFLFFILQLLMRLAGWMIAVRIPEESLTFLYWTDALASVSLLLISFWPFLREMAKAIAK